MIDSTFLIFVLGAMAFLVLVCLIYVASLWKVPSGPDEQDDVDPSGLVRLAASFQRKTESKSSMNFEDALLLAVRVRNGLTIGFLGFASLVVLCATVIICSAMKK